MILNIHTYLDICCCSVAKSCLTLHKHMDCSMPGFPVPHHLPEFAQVHIHCVGDISSSVVLFFCLQSFPASVSFLMSQLLASGGQSIGASASASVLPRSIQSWFPLRLTGLISLPARDSQESSPTSQLKSVNSLMFCLLYCPALTSVHDCWKNHSLDNTDLCQQSDVFAF